MAFRIPLVGERGAGLYALVDEQDYDRIRVRNWHITAGGYAAAGRYVRTANGAESCEVTYMHRAVLQADAGTMVDHIDGDKLNNRRSNLRLTNHSGNAKNAKPRRSYAGRPPTSRYKGVSWVPKSQRWRAQIKTDVQMGLGLYEDEVTAALAYDRAARKHFGEFARPNFPERYTYDDVPYYRPQNKSGLWGVSWHAGNRMWHARLSRRGKLVHSSYHQNADDAARAYDRAAIAHGERLRLNYPEEML